MTVRSHPKVYIDGQAGTTALRIFEILKGRKDIDLLKLPDKLRKDDVARQKIISKSDLGILCLPDAAARLAAEWATQSDTKVIDASTAHRVSDGWTYGLPELGVEQRELIRKANFVANPGCYPTSIILLLRPLISEGILGADCGVVIHALSGYSGGGRKLIEHWEDVGTELPTLPFSAPYALKRVHKHVPEIMEYTGLKAEPQFLPRVGPFFQGMRVEIPLHASWLSSASKNAAEKIWELLRDQYGSERFVGVSPLEPKVTDEFQFDPRSCNKTNRVELSVNPHPSGHVLLVGILDNLGKGASGAAVQSMNLMLGFEEESGLTA